MRKPAFAALLLLLAAAPLLAQGANRITVWTSRTEMQGENDYPGGFTTDLPEGSALGLSVHRFFGRFLAAEAAAFGLRSNAALAFEGTSIPIGKLDLTVATLGGQFHAFRDARLDPYAGAGAAYVMADDLLSPELQATGINRLELGSEFTWFVNAGIGLRITDGLGIVLDARYVPYETTARSQTTGISRDLDVSPRVYSLGLRMKF